VRALDGSGRFAVIDGHRLCDALPGFGPPLLPGGGGGGHSRVVDLQTGQTVLDLGDAPIGPARFGPPGDDGLPDVVAVGWATAPGYDVHDLDTGAELGSYPVPNADILNTTLSSDWRRLALTTRGGDLIVVDTDALRRVDDPDDAVDWEVVAHNGLVPGLSISDGGLIATGAQSGEVRVWSPTGELVADLPIEPDDPPTLTFAPGTDTLYYEDGGGVIRRFIMDPDEAIELATSMLTRGFTPEECRRYFPGEPCPRFDR
jgi:hypothetical protein